MKKSAILQMHYGERGHYELMKPTREYNRLLDIVVAKGDELQEKLAVSPELLNLYEQYNTAVDRLSLEEEDNIYVEGFRFGFLMGLDVAQPPESDEED